MRRRTSLIGAALLMVVAALVVADPGASSPVVSSITWRAGSAQPFGNSEGQAVVVGGTLYSFGGFDSTRPCCTPTRRVYAYDLDANRWSARRDLPVGLTHGGFATDGTDVFYAGGYIEKPPVTPGDPPSGQIFGTTQAWRYSPATDSYRRLPDLPATRAAGGLAWLSGRLHYVAGTNLRRDADVTDHFVLDLAGGATSWTRAQPIPVGRTHFATVVLDGRIFVIGGQLGHDAVLQPRADVTAYDPGTDSWSVRAPLPRPRNHHMSTTVVVDGRILVMGGQTTHNTPVDQVDRYDPARNAWTTLNPLPVPRHSAVGGLVDDTLVLSTGNADRRTWLGRMNRTDDGTTPPTSGGPGGGSTTSTTVGGGSVDPDDDHDGHGGHEGHGPPSGTSRLVSVAPQRLLDTRAGLGAPPGPVAPGSTTEVQVAGLGGLPATGVTAVVLNVVGVDAAAAGFVQAMPGVGGPEADRVPGSSSTLNLEGPGDTVANLAVVPVGPGGTVGLHSQSGGHLVADVFGWFEAANASRAGRVLTADPVRVLDTRTGLGLGGAVHEPSDQAKAAAGTAVRLSRSSLPAGAAAVVLNVTATQAERPGYVQAVPAGSGVAFGSSSNLNVDAGATVANLVVVPVGPDGVDLFTQERTHLVVDLLGHVTGAAAAESGEGLFVPLTPGRVLDTRPGSTPVAAGQGALVQPGGQVGVPSSGVGAVMANLTATESAAPGFVQLAPTGAAEGASSSLNVERPGQTVANAAVARIGSDGRVQVWTQSGGHLLLDVSGWFTS